MRTVGVRELKAKTSEILEHVRKGEHLVITVRGREVARLVPYEEDPDVAAAWKLVRGGHAAWSGGKPAGPWPLIPVKGRPVSETLLEDRE